MSLRYTAANLSRIRKPGSTGKKSPLSPLKAKKVTKKAPPKKDDTPEEPLQVISHDVQLDFQLHGFQDIVDAIDTIKANQWAERTCFHQRYYTNEAKSHSSPQDLLFLLRGLSMETKADIIKYRELQLPQDGMITVSQLYSMFENRGNTFVDRSLEMCIREGTLKKFVITNAMPVVLRTGKGGREGKVTYGYENVDVVVKMLQYSDLIDRTILSSDEETAAALKRFKEFIEADPSTLHVTSENLDSSHLSKLVKTGFVTLTSNHLNEIESSQYSVAYPQCGTFLKMINSGRSWLVKTLNKSKFKELLEESIFEKWEGKNMANFRKPFYGYDLLWIFADALGAGVVEAFKTPVGRGWRLTGKL